jgi:hypothetical protein
MKRLALAGVARRMLLSVTFWRVLPTPATLYLNCARVREPVTPPRFPLQNGRTGNAVPSSTEARTVSGASRARDLAWPL